MVYEQTSFSLHYMLNSVFTFYSSKYVQKLRKKDSKEKVRKKMKE